MDPIGNALAERGVDVQTSAPESHAEAMLKKERDLRMLFKNVHACHWLRLFCLVICFCGTLTMEVHGDENRDLECRLWADSMVKNTPKWRLVALRGRESSDSVRFAVLALRDNPRMLAVFLHHVGTEKYRLSFSLCDSSGQNIRFVRPEQPAPLHLDAGDGQIGTILDCRNSTGEIFLRVCKQTSASEDTDPSKVTTETVRVVVGKREADSPMPGGISHSILVYDVVNVNDKRAPLIVSIGYCVDVNELMRVKVADFRLRSVQDQNGAKIEGDRQVTLHAVRVHSDIYWKQRTLGKEGYRWCEFSIGGRIHLEVGNGYRNTDTLYDSRKESGWLLDAEPSK